MRGEYFRQPVTVSTLLSHQEKSPILCFFCKEPHKNQNCGIVSDIQTRKNVVRTSKRCFVCLKVSHLAKDCSSKIKCFKCSKQHHAALCDLEESSHSGKCSQLSYITQQLRNRLKLKTVSTRKISIQTFGNNCSENILEKVNLRILV